MNYYRVEWNDQSGVHNRIVEMESKSELEHRIAGNSWIFAIDVRNLKITEVKEYQVTWTQHNICTVFAASETEAFDAAAERAEDRDTGEDCDNYEIMELAQTKTDRYNVLDELRIGSAGDMLDHDAEGNPIWKPEIEVSDSMIFNYNTDEIDYEVLNDD